MSKKELRDLLYQKASKEQDEYIEHLKTLFPQEIIDKSYEEVMRADILATFEDDYLSDKQVAELIKLGYPLYARYNEWIDTYGDKLPHNYKVVITKPTCTEIEFFTYTFSYCS